jgi:ribose transport system substrate-binding protein
VLSAETAATEVLRENKSINAFFCTEGGNTLGVAQVLIDNNLVGDMVLVGFGNETEIIEYIEKGNIIEASIATDHEDIGKKIILAFHEYQTNHFVSSFINTDLQVVDENNVKTYLNEMSEINGQTK